MKKENQKKFAFLTSVFMLVIFLAGCDNLSNFGANYATVYIRLGDTNSRAITNTGLPAITSENTTILVEDDKGNTLGEGSTNLKLKIKSNTNIKITVKIKEALATWISTKEYKVSSGQNHVNIKLSRFAKVFIPIPYVYNKGTSPAEDSISNRIPGIEEPKKTAVDEIIARDGKGRIYFREDGKLVRYNANGSKDEAFSALMNEAPYKDINITKVKIKADARTNSLYLFEDYDKLYRITDDNIGHQITYKPKADSLFVYNKTLFRIEKNNFTKKINIFVNRINDTSSGFEISGTVHEVSIDFTRENAKISDVYATDTAVYMLINDIITPDKIDSSNPNAYSKGAIIKVPYNYKTAKLSDKILLGLGKQEPANKMIDTNEESEFYGAEKFIGKDENNNLFISDNGFTLKKGDNPGDKPKIYQNVNRIAKFNENTNTLEFKYVAKDISWAKEWEATGGTAGGGSSSSVGGTLLWSAKKIPAGSPMPVGGRFNFWFGDKDSTYASSENKLEASSGYSLSPVFCIDDDNNLWIVEQKEGEKDQVLKFEFKNNKYIKSSEPPIVISLPANAYGVGDITVAKVGGTTRLYYAYNQRTIDASGEVISENNIIDYMILGTTTRISVTDIEDNDPSYPPSYSGFKLAADETGVFVAYLIENERWTSSGYVKEVVAINILKYKDKDTADPSKGMEEDTSVTIPNLVNSSYIGIKDEKPRLNDIRVWNSSLYVLASKESGSFDVIVPAGEEPKIFGKILKIDGSAVETFFPTGGNTGEAYKPDRFIGISNENFTVASDAFKASSSTREQENKRLVCNADGINSEEKVKTEFINRLHTFDGKHGYAWDSKDDESVYHPFFVSLLWDTDEKGKFNFWSGSNYIGPFSYSYKGEKLNVKLGGIFTDVFCFDADKNLWIVEKDDLFNTYYAIKFEAKNELEYKTEGSDSIELKVAGSKNITDIIDITVANFGTDKRIYFVYSDESKTTKSYTNIDYINLSSPTTSVEVLNEVGDRVITAISSDQGELLVATKASGKYKIEQYNDNSGTMVKDPSKTTDISGQIGSGATLTVNDIEKWNSGIYVLASETMGNFGYTATTVPKIFGQVICIKNGSISNVYERTEDFNPYRFVGLDEDAIAIASDAYDDDNASIILNARKNMRLAYDKNGKKFEDRLREKFSKELHESYDPIHTLDKGGYAWDSYGLADPKAIFTYTLLWDAKYNYWSGDKDTTYTSASKKLTPNTNCKFTEVFCFDEYNNLWIVEKNTTNDKHFAQKFEPDTSGKYTASATTIELKVDTSKTVSEVLDIAVTKLGSVERIYFAYNDAVNATTNVDYINSDTPDTTVGVLNQPGNKVFTAITADEKDLYIARNDSGTYKVEQYIDNSGTIAKAQTFDISSSIGSESTVAVNDMQVWNSDLYVLASKTTGDFGYSSTTAPQIFGQIIRIKDGSISELLASTEQYNPYRFIEISHSAIAVASDAFDASSGRKQVNKKLIFLKDNDKKECEAEIKAEFSKKLRKARDTVSGKYDGYEWSSMTGPVIPPSKPFFLWTREGWNKKYWIGDGSIAYDDVDASYQINFDMKYSFTGKFCYDEDNVLYLLEERNKEYYLRQINITTNGVEDVQRFKINLSNTNIYVADYMRVAVTKLSDGTKRAYILYYTNKKPDGTSETHWYVDYKDLDPANPDDGTVVNLINDPDRNYGRIYSITAKANDLFVFTMLSTPNMMTGDYIYKLLKFNVNASTAENKGEIDLSDLISDGASGLLELVDMKIVDTSLYITAAKYVFETGKLASGSAIFSLDDIGDDISGKSVNTIFENSFAPFDSDGQGGYYITNILFAKDAKLYMINDGFYKDSTSGESLQVNKILELDYTSPSPTVKKIDLDESIEFTEKRKL